MPHTVIPALGRPRQKDLLPTRLKTVGLHSDFHGQPELSISCLKPSPQIKCVVCWVFLGGRQEGTEVQYAAPSWPGTHYADQDFTQTGLTVPPMC